MKQQAEGTLDADRIYRLFAIIVHIGSGPHHGHYITVVKHLDSWFVIDDDEAQVCQNVSETLKNTQACGRKFRSWNFKRFLAIAKARGTCSFT